MIEVDGIDEALVAAIARMRGRYHACTARYIANELNLHHTYVSQRLRVLEAQGIVGFDIQVPGSIHIVGTVETLPDGLFADGVPEAAPRGKKVKLGIDRERAAAAIAKRAETTAAPAKKAEAAVKKSPAKKPAVKKSPVVKFPPANTKAIGSVITSRFE